jgi:hypothetical protein
MPSSESMKRQTLTIEHCLYLLAFLLALGVRLLRLGTAPLSEVEADWALQALNLSRGETVLLGTQPLYILLTSLFFALLGSGNGLARLFPALAGSALVFVPLLWSRSFRRFRVAALIAAFGLALDPGLVAASRLAGGPVPAVTFVLLALGFALCQSAAWTGVFGGLALLTGVPVVPGLLGLALTWGAAEWLKSLGVMAPLLDEDNGSFTARFPAGFIRKTALFGGATILLAGTFLLLVPQGIASAADTFTAYLRGWVRPSGVLVFRSLAALALYQPLALFFGIAGAVRGWGMREPVSQRLSLWACLALLLALIYPARQTVDLVWALVPLWVLAAWELQHHLPAAEEDAAARGPALVFAAGVTVLLGVAWLGLIAGQVELVGLAWAMLFAIALMVGMWSLKVMRYGLVWGVCAALIIGMLASMFGMAQVHPNGAQELWSISPQTGEADLLLGTLENLSQWKTGERQALDVTVSSDSSVLRWLLRDFRAAHFSPDFTGAGVTDENAPSVVITHQNQNIPGLPVLYRGQDFILYIFPGWTQVLPNDWIKWLAYREAPLAKSQVILWARTDLFPGGILERAVSTTGPAIFPGNPPLPDLNPEAP